MTSSINNPSVCFQITNGRTCRSVMEAAPMEVPQSTLGHILNMDKAEHINGSIAFPSQERGEEDDADDITWAKLFAKPCYVMWILLALHSRLAAATASIGRHCARIHVHDFC